MAEERAKISSYIRQNNTRLATDHTRIYLIGKGKDELSKMRKLQAFIYRGREAAVAGAQQAYEWRAYA